jgi:Flp pilus assembly protein CpaB
MNRRTIAIIVFIVGIVLLAVVGLSFLNSQGAGQADETPTPQPEVNELGTPIATEEGAPPPVDEQIPSDLPPMMEVVVSLQTVPRGWLITENELTTDLRVADAIPSNVITQIEDVVGKFARTDIFQGETITFDDLAEDITLIGQNEFGPSSLIPPGFIAASIPIDRLSSVAYGASEGDYVDIMITFLFSEIDREFQSYLLNSGIVIIEEIDPESGEPSVEIVVIPQLGIFEELATGEIAHVRPSEDQRPIPITMILQNARVIQVGQFVPPEDVTVPTPTPEVVEGEETPTPEAGEIPPTATPPPGVLVVALSPQQQLFLKYAVESTADIDFALRGVNDGQLYEVENMDLLSFMERYNIEVPPNTNFTLDITRMPSEGESPAAVQPTPTVAQAGGG